MWSHMGWFMCTHKHDDIRDNRVTDLLKYPELRWIDDRHHIFFLAHAALIGAFFGWQGFLWGFLVSFMGCSHASYGINSVVHVKEIPGSSRRFETTDDSQNNWWFALLTHGEGWHNNHHAFQHSCRQGLYWYEWDFTYYVLRALALVGIVWDIKEPSYKKIQAKQLALTNQ